jgi:hypothetical protein
LVVVGTGNYSEVVSKDCRFRDGMDGHREDFPKANVQPSKTKMTSLEIITLLDVGLWRWDSAK